MRAKLSKRNKWWIPKHRYYELKHFCLQYPEYKREANDIFVMDKTGCIRSTEWSDPTGNTVCRSEAARRKMQLIEECSRMASEELSGYILRAVTEGLSYVTLEMMHNIPCGRDMFYDRVRKFFFILSVRK